MLHAQALHDPVLFPLALQAAALHGAVQRQLEGEHRRRTAVFCRVVSGSLNHRLMTQVNAVKKAEGDAAPPADGQVRFQRL